MQPLLTGSLLYGILETVKHLDECGNWSRLLCETLALSCSYIYISQHRVLHILWYTVYTGYFVYSVYTMALFRSYIGGTVLTTLYWTISPHPLAVFRLVDYGSILPYVAYCKHPIVSSNQSTPQTPLSGDLHNFNQLSGPARRLLHICWRCARVSQCAHMWSQCMAWDLISVLRHAVFCSSPVLKPQTWINQKLHQMLTK